MRLLITQLNGQLEREGKQLNSNKIKMSNEIYQIDDLL